VLRDLELRALTKAT